jgi:hypothetical protein
MFSHHRSSLTNYVKSIENDPNILAVITSGSIAQGKARENSDIDIYLLVTDHEFDARKQAGTLSFTDHDSCNYQDGYIDIKTINLQFLELAAKQGSEPTRASFIGSQIIFSKIDGLEDLLHKIPIYPEANRINNIRDFQAQVMLFAYYFASEAIQKSNPYLLTHTVSNLVLFGSRIILAHNRILFPCHKSMMSVVESAPEKPNNYKALVLNLIEAPTLEKCLEFATAILTFRPLELANDEALSLFILNNEWNWLEQNPPLQDR